MDQGEDRTPPKRSLRGLDVLNLTMADVRDGLGPYLSAYRKADRQWEAGPIGLAMAVGNVAAAICQVPAGLLVDATRAKRALVAGAGLMIGAMCVLITAVPGLWVVMGAQAMLGAASAVIPPALAALSLGIVGRRLMPARVSRNESFNHAGNLTAAALAAAFGAWLGHRWIFYLVCAVAAASAAAVMLIDPASVNHRVARGEDESDGDAMPLRQVFRVPGLTVFLVSVLLFHFGNAAMLPLAGQVLAQTHPGQDTVALSACIIAAQAVMVGVAWVVGKALARNVGRKTIFLVALAVLPIRGLLFTQIGSPVGIVAIQLLDGVAAGIFGVISIVIASDLMAGTGRFNLAQGLVALATGVGAGLSNLCAGYVVQWFGYGVAFLALAGLATAALAFFAVFMPETGQTTARR